MANFLNGGLQSAGLVVRMSLHSDGDPFVIALEAEHLIRRLLNACQKPPRLIVEGVLDDHIHLEVHKAVGYRTYVRISSELAEATICKAILLVKASPPLARFVTSDGVVPMDYRPAVYPVDLQLGLRLG